MSKFLILLFICAPAFAVPQDIEVWFLSNAKVSELGELLRRPDVRFSAKTAELQCEVMGDYCFDPQFGLYKKDDLDFDARPTVEAGPTIPTGASVDRDVINCESTNYFDVFCGKARAEAKSAKPALDLWVDTSSSMREFDHAAKDGSCHRKSLVRKLDVTCGFNQKVNVMMFDTSIKQAGDMSSLCTNQGLNDHKRLRDWVERSDAKKLVIITDIYEFHKEFSDYIESKHGRLRGDKKPLTASELAALADELAKSCK